MKLVLVFILASQLLAMNNQSEQEFIINEPEKTPEKFPILTSIDNSPKNNNQQQLKIISSGTGTRPANNLETLDNTGLEALDVAIPSQARDETAPVTIGARQENRSIRGDVHIMKQEQTDYGLKVRRGQTGRDGRDAVDSRSTQRNINVMVPENANQVQRRDTGQTRQTNVQTTQIVRQETVRLEPLNQQNVDAGQPKGPRFISFGIDKGSDLQYQNLLAKILNFGMLSMFTDLTDQATTITLMLVMKQDQQIAGKEIYKVIFKVQNPKYVTGEIFYGTEFAVTAGELDPNPNQIDFISFGKSVILDNLLGLLSIKEEQFNSRVSLAHVNETRNAENLDFNSQSKSAMVEFIQTILTLAQGESKKQIMAKEDCEDENKPAKKEHDNTLIGSAAEFDFAFGDKL